MKGILFSLILFFVTIFLALFLITQKSFVSFYSSQKAVENRIESMIILSKNVFEDSERALAIIGKRACVSAINFIITNGMPLNSSNETLVELIINGTINSNPQPLMEGATVNDWIDTLENLIDLQGFQAKIEIQKLIIQPYDSFNLEIDYRMKVEISDLRTKTNLTKVQDRKVLLNIEKLEDPLYPLNTYGRIVNTIVKSPHWLNYSSKDTSNLLDDLNNSYYHPSLYGASFLDRLEGKYFVQQKYWKKNPIGLESFVNKDKILSVGLPIIVNLTNIDYLYFSNSNVTSYRIANMPDNFRLDNETTIENKTHLQIYNVSVIP
ncbi:MAG: hypothetical protein ACP5F8_01300 [Candidatus Aenigmatarchaeota archaeon]